MERSYPEIKYSAEKRIDPCRKARANVHRRIWISLIT